MHTVEETAALIALLAHRADRPTPLILHRTIMALGRRKHLKRGFIKPLRQVLLDEFDLHLVQYKSGAFTVIREPAAGVAAVTAKVLLGEHRARWLKKLPVDFASVLAELGYVVDEDETW